jgi:type VI secretion system protein
MKLACVVAIVVLLAACSVGRKVRSAFGGKLPIEVTIADDANDNSPVAVDLLLVYDDKLVDKLREMPAADWFKNKEQYVADHPSVIVKSWEWAPGQAIEPIHVEYRAGARNVLLFADYQTEGPHREVVGPPKPFKIILGPRDLSVEVPQ